MAVFLLMAARPAVAARVFRRALDDSLDARAMTPLAGALLAAGELEEALELAQRRTREKPSDPEGWRVASAVLLAEGYDDEARATLERAASLPGQRREDYQARLDELAKARAAQAHRRMTEELLK